MRLAPRRGSTTTRSRVLPGAGWRRSLSKERRGTSSRNSEVKGTLLAVRMPTSLMAALDQQLVAMRTETPWVSMTRSDAVRWLLGLALERERARLFEQRRDPPATAAG
jgi:hypothetical protein